MVGWPPDGLNSRTEVTSCRTSLYVRLDLPLASVDTCSNWVTPERSGPNPKLVLLTVPSGMVTRVGRSRTSKLVTVGATGSTAGLNVVFAAPLGSVIGYDWRTGRPTKSYTMCPETVITSAGGVSGPVKTVASFL